MLVAMCLARFLVSIVKNAIFRELSTCRHALKIPEDGAFFIAVHAERVFF